MLYQVEWYPHFAYNENTYDIQLISKKTYEESLAYYNKPKTGCLALLQQCRELGEQLDPLELGLSDKANQVCKAAELGCSTKVSGAWNADTSIAGDRSAFDIAHLNPDGHPTNYLIGFFNQEWVQKELGVPVNFTANSNLVGNVLVFSPPYDAYRRAGMKDIEYLLDSGVKVTLMYGDRDYVCPWLGVEKLSLAANWTGADNFRTAGYQQVQKDDKDLQGVVRQHGNLSFTRVLQAGHDGKQPLLKISDQRS